MIKLFLFIIALLPDKDEEPDRYFDGEVLGFSMDAFLLFMSFVLVFAILGFLLKRFLIKKGLTIILMLFGLSVFASPPKGTPPPGASIAMTPKNNVSSIGDKGGYSETLPRKEMEMWIKTGAFSLIGLMFLTGVLLYRSIDVSES